jgi:hypothetical protein
VHRREVIELPPVANLVTHAGRHLLEATIAPLALFYLTLHLLGLRGALVAGLVWSYSALARRLVLRQRIPGVLVIGAVLLTLRTTLAWVTGSVFLYLLQPTLGTFLVAGLFLVSVLARRPLAERLAHDFCPLPESLLANGRMTRFFAGISLLWAAVYIVNGGATLALLMSSTVGTFLVVKTVASASLTALAVAASYGLFRITMRNEGVRLVLRWRAGTAAPEAATA